MSRLSIHLRYPSVLCSGVGNVRSLISLPILAPNTNYKIIKIRKLTRLNSQSLFLSLDLGTKYKDRRLLFSVDVSSRVLLPIRPRFSLLITCLSSSFLKQNMRQSTNLESPQKTTTLGWHRQPRWVFGLLPFPRGMPGGTGNAAKFSLKSNDHKPRNSILHHHWCKDVVTLLELIGASHAVVSTAHTFPLTVVQVIKLVDHLPLLPR